VNNTDTCSNPSYLVPSHNGKYLYAVNETHGTDPGKVSAYTFNKTTGELQLLNSQFTGGDDPCYVALTRNDQWLTVANYTGGSVAIFRVNKNGSLKPYEQLIQDSGSSINKNRQEKAHVHSTVFSPGEDYLFTPDLGMDKVMVYRFDRQSGQPLKPSAPSFVSTIAGSGPRHFTFHPNKRFAYLVSELSGTVSAYNYYKGHLAKLQEVAAHPKDYHGVIGSADIHISPDGKFLYVSNRGDENTITIFSVNDITGKLKLQGFQPSLGKTPRNFIIDPTGRYLLVANQESNNVVIFRRNIKTGLLVATGKQLSIPKPVCLQMTLEK
jgi:3-carboxymuconate cyclase